MKKTAAALLLIFLTILPSAAQEKLQAYMSADLVSSYLWRGHRIAGAGIQPVLGLKYRGLNFFIWGNEQLCPPSDEPIEHEINYFLKYSLTPDFVVGFKDVYINTRGDGFFSFGSIPHAANGLDVILAYNFKYVNLEWTTAIAGYDGYNHSGKRSYSSYLLITAPFSLGLLDWEAEMGIAPWYSTRYGDCSDGFHVNMCCVKAAHSFCFTRSHIKLTPYTQLMVNPSVRKGYFMVGLNFSFNPSRD